MSALEELSESFDRRRCKGFTIWLTSDGWLQVNLQRHDGGCNCTSIKNLDELPDVIEKFNAYERKRGVSGERRPVDKQALAAKQSAKRRDMEDLI